MPDTRYTDMLEASTKNALSPLRRRLPRPVKNSSERGRLTGPCHLITGDNHYSGLIGSLPDSPGIPDPKRPPASFLFLEALQNHTVTKYSIILLRPSSFKRRD
jgi:hypothetical protein